MENAMIIGALISSAEMDMLCKEVCGTEGDNENREKTAQLLNIFCCSYFLDAHLFRIEDGTYGEEISDCEDELFIAEISHYPRLFEQAYRDEHALCANLRANNPELVELGILPKDDEALISRVVFANIIYDA